MKINRAVEILHKAVGENTKNNTELRNDIKEFCLSVDHHLVQLRLVDMRNTLRSAIILG